MDDGSSGDDVGRVPGVGVLVLLLNLWGLRCLFRWIPILSTSDLVSQLTGLVIHYSLCKCQVE